MILQTINQIKTELIKNPMRKGVILAKLAEIENEMHSIQSAINNEVPDRDIIETIDALI